MIWDMSRDTWGGLLVPQWSGSIDIFVKQVKLLKCLNVKIAESFIESFSETSAMHQPHHPLRPSQNFNKLPSGPMGMDPYR